MTTAYARVRRLGTHKAMREICWFCRFELQDLRSRQSSTLKADHCLHSYWFRRRKHLTEVVNGKRIARVKCSAIAIASRQNGNTLRTCERDQCG